MSKYILEILEPNNNHAGPKAKTDISYFLRNIGYNTIYLDSKLSKIKKMLFGKHLWRKKLKKLRDNDTFVIQYPIYSDFMFGMLSKVLQENKKLIKTIVVIHDLSSLRFFMDDKSKIKAEIDSLNNFDVLIVHNTHMQNWLKSNGVKKKMVTLELFDYKNPHVDKIYRDFSRSIVFAGNLNKSVFLNSLELDNRVMLFGPCDDVDRFKGTSIEYCGSYSPDELPLHINECGFGLVWDGESTNDCVGQLGNYLKYNNPHKTSLYLSCGIPVVIWKQAALANFISKNKLGIVVSSLREMDEKISAMTPEEYTEIKNNVIVISQKINHGKYIETAMFKAEGLITCGK